MALLSSQPLSAALGFALVLLSIWIFYRYFLTGVLLLMAVAYVAVPFTRSGDYVSHILLEQIVVVLLFYFRVLQLAWKGYVPSSIIFRILAGASVLVAAWIWIQRGVDHIIWVAVAVIGLIVVWRLVRNRGISVLAAESDLHYQAASEVTPELLMKRDQDLLGALYKAAHGCAGTFVAARDVAPFLQLSAHQAWIAARRLIDADKIEEGESGYALKRRGVEAYEQRIVIEKRRSPVSNIFNFHGSASGVFGSDNNVRGNKFTSGVLSPELIGRVLTSASQLRAEVSDEQARRIDAAVSDIQAGDEDRERLGRGARRLARIASTAGEIGAPLLRVAAELVAALPG